MGRDGIIGLGLLALCGVLYWQTNAILTPPFVPLGPAFYPRIILALLAALCIWLIAEDLLKRREPTPTPRPGPRPNYRLVGQCFVIFLAYVVSLNLIGFLAGTFLFVLGLSWLMGPRQIRELPKLALVAAGTTLVCFLVFEKYLHVFLPRGFLF